MNRRRTILVVDDEDEMLNLLARTLELEGFDVIRAEDGRAALAQLEEQRPGMVILDIMMPGLNGFQVLDLIRKRSDVPVIMLTGKTEVTTLEDAISVGADDYIRKPFQTRVLIARIRAKLRRTESQEIRWLPKVKPGKTGMIKVIIRFNNNMVMVFDEGGEQLSVYQGQYRDVKESILKDAAAEAIYAHGLTASGELQKVTRDNW